MPFEYGEQRDEQGNIIHEGSWGVKSSPKEAFEKIIENFRVLRDEGVSTEQLHEAIDTLVDGAPESLNTIRKLSNALGQKANQATTLAGYGITDAYTKTETDGKYAPTNNPIFTGVVTASQYKFPAVQNASTDPNTLDDYEEGIFTPNIAGSSIPGACTYTTQQGKYTKIGNVVHFRLSVEWSGHTGTGNVRIGGLPFVNAEATSTPVDIQSGNVTFSGNLSASVFQSASYCRVYNINSGAYATEVNITAAGVFNISGTYFTN